MDTAEASKTIYYLFIYMVDGGDAMRQALELQMYHGYLRSTHMYSACSEAVGARILPPAALQHRQYRVICI